MQKLVHIEMQKSHIRKWSIFESCIRVISNNHYFSLLTWLSLKVTLNFLSHSNTYIFNWIHSHCVCFSFLVVFNMPRISVSLDISKISKSHLLTSLSSESLHFQDVLLLRFVKSMFPSIEVYCEDQAQI